MKNTAEIEAGLITIVGEMEARLIKKNIADMEAGLTKNIAE